MKQNFKRWLVTLVCLMSFCAPALAQVSPETQRADSLMAARYFGEALDIYKTEHRNDPSNPALFEKMAAAAFAKEKFQAAVLWYDSAIAVATDTAIANLHYGKAKAYYGLKQWEDVIRETTLAISLRARSKYLGLRGYAYEQIDSQRLAMADYVSAVRKGSTEPGALAGYAGMLRDSGLLAEALVYADSAIKSDPEFWAGYVVRATISMSMLKIVAACNDIAKARVLGYTGNVDIPEAACNGDKYTKLLSGAEYCTRHGQYTQAVAAYNSLIDEHGASSMYLINRAICYSRSGQIIRAEKDYIAAEKIVRAEDKKILYHNMGQFYRARNMAGAAIIYMTKEMALLPPAAELYYLRSTQNMQLKRYPEALSDLDSALLLNPKLEPALATRSLVYLEMKNYEKAEADANRLINMGSDLGAGEFLLGMAMMGQQKTGYCEHLKTSLQLGFKPGIAAYRKHCL